MEGVAAGQPGRSHPHQVVPGARAHSQPTTLSYQSEVKKTSLLKKTKSLKRNTSERFNSSEVQYFLNDSKKWTDKARISTNTTRTKLYLDYNLGKVSRLDRSLSLSSVSSLTSVKLRRSLSSAGSDLSRIKFGLNSSLEVEHAANLSWNFQVVIGNEFGRHKVAFYSEDEARNFVRLAINKGAIQKISNDLLIESTSSTASTPTLRKSQSFNVGQRQRKPLRPISENLQYFEESFPEETELDDDFDDDVIVARTSATMPTPTQISNNSSKILRRKSTGSSDTSKSTNFLRKKSPMSSTVSVTSGDQKFQRRNSMTGRFKRGVVNGTAVWYDKNVIDTSQKSDAYYDDATISAYSDRLKAKKKSHNSLESEEMTSDDGCATSPDDSDVSESDEDVSPNSLASHGSYEDLVRTYNLKGPLRVLLVTIDEVLKMEVLL